MTFKELENYYGDEWGLSYTGGHDDGGNDYYGYKYVNDEWVFDDENYRRGPNGTIFYRKKSK